MGQAQDLPDRQTAVKPACGCDEQVCDCQAVKAANAKALKAYKTLFYANDFSYLCDPCSVDRFGDSLKQLQVGECGLLDIGGQLRLRYHNELGMKAPSRFQPATSDNFLLTRLRLFGNYQANDRWRFYAEALYADSSGESFSPRGIDENFMDFLNAFIDLRYRQCHAAGRATRAVVWFSTAHFTSRLGQHPSDV